VTSPSPFATQLRSHLCGALRLEHSGSLVRLGGWVHRRRDLGGLVFLDLRDRSGIVQISCNPDTTPADALAAAASAGAETVLLVEGEVLARPDEMRNPELATGDIEVRAARITVVGPAATPAIPVARGKGEPLPAEELRLRHRHLDLRRPELQANLILRHRLTQAARRYFDSLGFLEIETPILTRPTPEGARDFLVPSRVHPGEFYALPQSPQLYKQLLMVSGYDRYFQIARCFRDEDLRADRQLEFTQIDVEASFIGPEDVYAFTEGLLRALWAEAGIDVPTPFRRMTYAEAMERFGTDRPDLRYGLEIRDATALFRESDFSIARSVIEQGGRIRAITIRDGGAMSRKQVDELEAVAKGAGAGGLLRLKKANGGLEGPAARFLPSAAGDTLGLHDGDLAVMVAAPDHVSSPALDRVRQEVARRLELVPARATEFLWVTDFPAFARDPETGALTFVHHPFTAPHPDDLPLLDDEPERARALAYDVVLNGSELGGGSIRISDPRLQERVFSLLGLDAEEAEQRFAFLLEGLRSGAPPHGGIALGLDRIAMLLAGASSLRDVIAYPKTTAARALFEGAPAAVPDDDLRALHVAVREEAAT
jgi:aspartyl-tRNA synthetase